MDWKQSVAARYALLSRKSYIFVKVKRHTLAKLSKTVSGLKQSVDALHGAVQTSDAAVSGLRKALTEDIADGVTPPLIYSKQLRYGINVPLLCGTCGSRISEENWALSERDVAQYVYGCGRSAFDKAVNRQKKKRGKM